MFAYYWKNVKLGTNKLKLDFKLFTENIISTQQYPKNMTKNAVFFVD